MRKLIWFCVALVLSSGITGLMGCGGDSEEELEEVKSGPSIFSIIPENGAKDVPTTTSIVVVFGEEIDTPSSGNLLFTPGVGGDVSYDSDSHTLVFRPSSDLSNHTDYSLTLEGIAGMDSSPMSPVTINFTTSVPDTKRPKIESTFPENGQKDIGHDTDIVVRFSEPMDRIKLRSGHNY
ncbi:Ig-like domain-containing protein [Candidatus Poribacteria bacterium]